jgi:predicted DNA repair protein MutK
MASGLFALLDDVAAIAKVAAASLDDVAGQAAKAGTKAAGIVIDDAAVTPRYVVGFASDRELHIIGRIALGSLRNKILFLLPGALALSYFLPWLITPLLMAGGAFLCFEGFEKVHDLVSPHARAQPTPALMPEGTDARATEDQRIASAIRTDFILSAEIMAITLATLGSMTFAMKAVTLGIVGLGMTALVYGAVALIVKADDVGAMLARSGRLGVTRGFGRMLVTGMPTFLKGLSLVGMVAMLWVGGGIIVHGLHEFGWKVPEDAFKAAGAAVAAPLGPVGPVAAWGVGAALSALVGLVIGWGVAQAVHAVERLRGAPAH